jgi:hypothetical protein
MVGEVGFTGRGSVCGGAGGAMGSVCGIVSGVYYPILADKNRNQNGPVVFIAD